MQNCLVCSLTCSYNQYGKISSLIPDNGGVIDDSVFETDVKLSFHIKPDGLPALNKKLADLTSGVVQAVSDSEQYFMTEI
jgi:putative IMPACT (imprinted ancient) family translation regulator